MKFIESYKHLEKLCNECLNSHKGVSAYIEEMECRYEGTHYVPGWEQDYKNLKHYRWVRNQIAHEPGCAEDNMCSPEDAVWLETFCGRIMRQTDPLALCRKEKQNRAMARQKKSTPQPKPIQQQSVYVPISKPKRQSKRWIGYVGLLIALVSLIAIVVILMQM